MTKRFLAGGTGRLACAIVFSSACWATTIPLTSTGSLGVLDVAGVVTFNTDAGTYQIGTTTFTGGRAVTLDSSGMPAQAEVFDFSSISLPTGSLVTAVGNGPLILLAQTTAFLDGSINVSGAAGMAGGTQGGGGGGGAGGGSLAIFADSVTIGSTGSLFANGGASGQSDFGAANQNGGSGGTPVAGGGTGGDGGGSVAGGKGGNGGNGPFWGGAGGGGAGGGGYDGPLGTGGWGSGFVLYQGGNGAAGGGPVSCSPYVPGDGGAGAAGYDAGAGHGGDGGSTNGGTATGGTPATYRAGGGGGGGGADACKSSGISPSGGKKGGGGAGGGSSGGTGGGGSVVTSPLQGGGGGGGGAIVLGAASNSILNMGTLSVLGGTNADLSLSGGAGVVDIYGVLNNSVTGSVQGNLFTSSGFTQDQFFLYGGGGGGGGGGDGQLIPDAPEPHPAALVLVGIALCVAGRVRPRKSGSPARAVSL